MTALDKIIPYSITFSVSDLQGMTEWYTKVLGFKVVDKKDYPEFKTSLVFLQLNGYRVELIKDGNAERIGSRFDVGRQCLVGVGSNRTATLNHQGIQEEGVGFRLEHRIEVRNEGRHQLLRSLQLIAAEHQ